MGRIQTRIAVVLKLLDLYTGQPVNIKNVRVSIKQQNHVIMKNDGFVVILESPGVHSLDIQIESGIYQKKEITIGIGDMVSQKGYPVWLQTKKGYPFGMNATIVKGNITDTTCMLTWENKERPIRLMADYEAGSSVIQLANTGEYAEGRYYRIGTKAQCEIFMLKEELAEQKQGYFLQEPCFKNYKRTESIVAQVYPITAEQNEFYFGIADIPREGTVCKIYRQGECIKEQQLEYGKENRLQW